MSDNNDDQLDIPKEAAWKRWGTSIIQGAISSAPLPFISGIAGNIFAELAEERIHHRQEQLLKDIVAGLEALRQEYEDLSMDLTVEKLATNDVFVTTLLQAVDAAERVYQQEKLEALRNIVLHTALSSATSSEWEYELRQPFLTLIKDLTPCEMQLLMFLHDPKGQGVPNFYKVSHRDIPSLTEIVLERIPCLNSVGHYSFFLNDLVSRGLAVEQQRRDETRPIPRTTSAGDEFIWFIQSPLSEQQ